MNGELKQTIGLRDRRTGIVTYYGPGKVTVDAETGRRLGLESTPDTTEPAKNPATKKAEAKGDAKEETKEE